MVSLRKAWEKAWRPSARPNPYATNPTATQSGAVLPGSTPRPEIPRPASAREQRDFLAEARQAAGLDRVVGAKGKGKGKVGVGVERDGGEGGDGSGNGEAVEYDEFRAYHQYVLDMKRRRDGGNQERLTEFYAPQGGQPTEYYAPAAQPGLGTRVQEPRGQGQGEAGNGKRAGWRQALGRVSYKD